MTASFILEIDESASTASAKVFRPNSGTVTWSSFAFDGVCTTTARPEIEALRPEDGALNFFLDDTGSTIDAEGVMYRPPRPPPSTRTATTTVTGRIDIPPFLSEWSFTR